MEWKILIKKEESIFRIFKILQLANSDIIIIPHKSIYLGRNFLLSSKIGDKLIISTKSNDAIIHHYSAHSKTGERHVKYAPQKDANDLIFGPSFKNNDNVVPLVSIVATVNRMPDGIQKGRWIGFNIPNGADYCIFDVFIIPFNVNIRFKFEHLINNVKKSTETYDYKIIPLRFCNIVLFIKTSTHNLCEIPYNLMIQQTEGITAQIVRVSNSEIELDVSRMNIKSEK